MIKHIFNEHFDFLQTVPSYLITAFFHFLLTFSKPLHSYSSMFLVYFSIDCEIVLFVKFQLIFFFRTRIFVLNMLQICLNIQLLKEAFSLKDMS